MTSSSELAEAVLVVAVAIAGAGGLIAVLLLFGRTCDIADDEPTADEPLNGDSRACQYAHMHPEIRSKNTPLPPPIPFYEMQKKLNRWAGQIDPQNEYLKSQMREVMRELPPLRVEPVRKPARKRRKDAPVE